MEKDEFAIPVIECSTPKDFMDELDETHERWEHGTWIFRGQSNACWKLVPSAMRKSGFIAKRTAEANQQNLSRLMTDNEFVQRIDQQLGRNYDKYFTYEPTATSMRKSDDAGKRKNFILLTSHYALERVLVLAFEDLADRVHLELPVDRSPTAWDKPVTFRDLLVSSFENVVLPDEKEPYRIMYALAQHHGVATRLLDWTYRPLVAAFFAAYHETKPPSKACAETAQQQEADPSRIVVYAVDQSAAGRTGLRVVKHRRSQIGFLKSQDGVFMFDAKANTDFMYYSEWLPLDYRLTEIADKNAVYKLTLPFCQRLELLRLLDKKQVSRPFLMPSFDNVAYEINCRPQEAIKRVTV
ncbi:MAG: FRG domain-containing protein [Chloroflexi bacterium]|nr:FRG domain-containing protein [Chloroflexota bacterium]